MDGTTPRRLEHVPRHVLEACDVANAPPFGLPQSFKIEKEANDAFSLVGQ